jgi:hypothetical protein
MKNLKNVKESVKNENDLKNIDPNEDLSHIYKFNKNLNNFIYT